MKRIFSLPNLFLTMISIFILLFWIITFGASSLEKLFNFQVNLEWLKEYLRGTPFLNFLYPLLIFVLFLEVTATLLCSFALFIYIVSDVTFASISTFSIITKAGISVGIFTLLCFLIGQRWVKDYEGARGMTLYIFAGIISLWLIQNELMS